MTPMAKICIINAYDVSRMFSRGDIIASMVPSLPQLLMLAEMTKASKKKKKSIFIGFMSIILCEGFPAGCMLILTQAQSL